MNPDCMPKRYDPKTVTFERTAMCWTLSPTCDTLFLSGMLEASVLPVATTEIIGIFDAGVEALETSLSNHVNISRLGLANNKLGVVAAR